MSARPLTLGLALLPIVAMLVLFIAGVLAFGSSAELLIVVLLGAAAVAGAIAARQGRTWDDLQRATGEKLASVLPAVLILLTIGMLVGTWVLSGTIPLLVYWGVQLVSPQYLVLTAFIATALMSSFTGTSWGSAGTVGVALMGTAIAIDAPLAATAGAVLSGAYFGDKMSPISDTTVICSMAAGAKLFPHIRHLLYTAVPSLTLSLLVYTAVAFVGDAPSGEMPASARVLLVDLERVFNLHWIVLIPPALVVVCIIRRVPPALAITLSSLAAAVVAIAVQGFTLNDAVIAGVSGVRADILARDGIDAASFSPDFLRLVERGGLYSMSSTLVVIIAAFILAAGMEVSGALDLLIARLLASARSLFRLVAATMTAGASMIALTSHGGVTALLIGGLFQNAYRERRLAPENLGRTLEDSITLTEPLMPWTVSGIYMATTVGVPTLEYAPWAVFCYGGPIFSLLIAALAGHTRGFGIKPLRPGDELTPAGAPPEAVIARP